MLSICWIIRWLQRIIEQIKIKKKLFIFISLSIGLLILSPLAVEITYMLLNQKTLIQQKDTIIFLAIPLATIRK